MMVLSPGFQLAGHTWAAQKHTNLSITLACNKRCCGEISQQSMLDDGLVARPPVGRTHAAWQRHQHGCAVMQQQNMLDAGKAIEAMVQQQS
jgi:hypothetical protein